MTGRLAWLFFCLSVGLSHAQSPPVGHIPGGNPNLSAGNLCDLTDRTTLIGEISLVQEATLFEGFGDSAAASKDFFIAGLTSSGVRRSLLKFDIQGFADDAQVLCAEIRLSLNFALSSPDAAPTEITLHQVLKDWTSNPASTFDDSLNGSPAEAGDVTWEYSSYPTIRWNNIGGDFGEEPLSTEQKTVDDNGTEYDWFGNTKRMHALVDQWISDPNSNYGVLIKSDEDPADPIAYNVYNGAGAYASLAPKLIVVYTAPSLGFPHKVAQDPNMPTNVPTVPPEMDDILIPTDSPTIFDDMLIGINTDSPTSSLVTNDDNAVSSSDTDAADNLDGDDPVGMTRTSNSNTEYTAIALSITGVALAAVVATMFGLIPSTSQTFPKEDLQPESSSVNPPEVV